MAEVYIKPVGAIFLADDHDRRVPCPMGRFDYSVFLHFINLLVDYCLHSRVSRPIALLDRLVGLQMDPVGNQARLFPRIWLVLGVGTPVIGILPRRYVWSCGRSGFTSGVGASPGGPGRCCECDSNTVPQVDAD